MKRLILGALALALVIVGISAMLPVQTRPQPAFGAAGASFDHSNCQYPDRWSNPPNGCDNSDPAVPECIKEFSTKAGEDACIARLYPGTAEKRQTIEDHSKPFKPAQPEQAAQCNGGK